MTTKTNLAMFAIAAFALTGMMGSSAFASQTTTNQDVNNTSHGTTQTSSPTWNTQVCQNVSGSTCEQKTKVYNNNSSDKVKVYVNVQNATCDIEIDWYNEGTPVAEYTKDNHSGTGQSFSKFFDISNTDDITTIVTYTNCY